MVVRLDLEDRRQAVADVHGAGVLARALQHARARGRQRPQMHARALVAAVLGPHHREDAELGQRRRAAAEHLDDAVVLLAREAVAIEQRVRDGRRRSSAERCSAALSADSKITRPSALPSTELARALGVRHQPHHVARRRCTGPRCRVTEPFGLASGVASPAGDDVAEDHLAVAFQRGRPRRAPRSSCLRRARSAASSTWPARQAAVNGVSVCSTRTCTCSQRNCRLVLRSIAPGQQPGLEQHLEAVADADHRAAGGGEALHLLHHRRKARDGAGAKVVAVGEAAGQDHDVGAGQRRVLVPDELGVLTQDVLGGVVGVVVAVGAGEDHDRELHDAAPGPSTSMR